LELLLEHKTVTKASQVLRSPQTTAIIVLNLYFIYTYTLANFASNCCGVNR